MKCLAVNTAMESPEVLAVNGEKRRYITIPGRQASAVFLPAVSRLLDQTGLSLQALDFMLAVTGPGSFTGIRIGLSSIKTFSEVTKVPVAALTSHEVLWFCRNAAADCVIVVTSGWANNCYMTVYDGAQNALLPTKSLSYPAAENLLASIDEPYELLTDSASAHLKNAHVCGGEAALSAAAEDAYRSKLFVPAAALEPFYLLLSQAERDLAHK